MLTKKAISVEEFAQTWGISRNTVYSLIKSGKIPAIRLGERRLLIPVDSAESLLRDGRCKEDT